MYMTMARSASGRAPTAVRTDRLTKAGLAATILIVFAASAAELINHGFDLKIQMLDSGSDGGVSGVLVDIAIATAAASAWLVTARMRSARPVAAILAVLLTFLAVDQVLALHNHIPHWLAFYLPLLLASFACLVALARGIPWLRRAGAGQGAGSAVIERLIGSGLALLVVSFLLHLFGEHLMASLGLSNPAGWAYQVKLVIKHGTEVAGWLLIALGLFRLGLPGRRHSGQDGGRTMVRA
jgi:hypothetical protein